MFVPDACPDARRLRQRGGPPAAAPNPVTSHRHPDLDYLAATAADLPAVSRFVAALNHAPETQCLHCPSTSLAEASASLRREDNFPGGWHRWFFKTTDARGRIVAAVGCQPDAGRTQGWLWGPWSTAEYPARDALGPLLDLAVGALPRSLRQLDAFLPVENRAGLGFLQASGFALRTSTHVYTALPPPGAAGSGLAADAGTARDAHAALGKEGVALLRAAHEVAFVNLHAASFPASVEPGRHLLDGRDDAHVILGAADGLRLLGYVCLSINHTPEEGFIDYLAVRPSARGRGVGGWLLGQALRWIFQVQGLPQASLCVTDWREDARRLYERAGFRLQATGRGARRYLEARR